jgi:enamine deaminase RidA (YjgF/YER057c/UK114 family)
MPSKIFNPEGLPPPTGYSHVAVVTGRNIVYISGQVASDTSGAIVGAGDFRAQVEQVFANLKRAVEGAGGKFQDIVKFNVFIVDSVGAGGIPAFREVRNRYVGSAMPPASTLLIVSGLARPEWLIEVEGVAVIG